MRASPLSNEPVAYVIIYLVHDDGTHYTRYLGRFYQ